MNKYNAEGIRERLKSVEDLYFQDLQIVDEIDSTNEALLSVAASGDNIDGRALVAECQSAGRGRQASVWHSPPAGNIYLSLGVKMSIKGSASGFSIAIGVAIARALDNERIWLKWPNDIYAAGRKLGGILIESAAAGEFVVGIGINVAMRAQDVGTAVIDQPWTSLSEEFGEVDRDEMLVRIMDEVSQAVPHFKATRLKDFRAEWQRLDMLDGKQVNLTLNPQLVIKGEAAGINQDGAILIKRGDNITPYFTGELRLA